MRERVRACGGFEDEDSEYGGGRVSMVSDFLVSNILMELLNGSDG